MHRSLPLGFQERLMPEVPLRRACEERRHTEIQTWPRSRQRARFDSRIGNCDKNMRRKSRKFLNRYRSCTSSYEQSCQRRSSRISTGKRRDRPAVLAKESSKRLRDAAGTDDSNRVHGVSHTFGSFLQIWALIVRAAGSGLICSDPPAPEVATKPTVSTITRRSAVMCGALIRRRSLLPPAIPARERRPGLHLNGLPGFRRRKSQTDARAN